MSVFRRTKGMKQMAQAAPGVMQQAHQLSQQAHQMFQAQQAAAQAQAARAAGGQPGAAPTGPDFEPIAGVTLDQYVAVVRSGATFSADQSRIAQIAAAHGISEFDWTDASAGWNSRIRSNPAVAQRFNQLYSFTGGPDMGMFTDNHNMRYQVWEMQQTMPSAAQSAQSMAIMQEHMARMQEHMARVQQMIAAQTQAATAAARAVDGPRCSVVINGMRQVGTINYEPLVEFELTVFPDGTLPYPATIQQPVSPMQIGQLRNGMTLQATADPSNPQAVWLDLASIG